MKRRLAKITHSATQPSRAVFRTATLSFIKHVYELRRRFVYIGISVVLGSTVAYAVERHIIAVLLRPAHGQSFIYTSPIDGINFLFKLCLYIGIVLSMPVIFYQFLCVIEPLMQQSSARVIRYGTLVSGVLAVGGMIFGYFVGLPAALHFSLDQFVTTQPHPLLPIDAYLSFVLVYMLGSAFVFQMPLVIMCINRIKPLTPGALIKWEHWAIFSIVVLGFIMNPTPNVLDQMFVVGPVILSYQLSILIIWWQNHTPKAVAHVRAMRMQDAKIQAERLSRYAFLQPLLHPTGSGAPQISVGGASRIASQYVMPRATFSHRPRQYVDGFSTNQRNRLVAS